MSTYKTHPPSSPSCRHHRYRRRGMHLISSWDPSCSKRSDSTHCHVPSAGKFPPAFDSYLFLISPRLCLSRLSASASHHLPPPTPPPSLLRSFLHGARRLRMNSAHYDKMKELFRRAGAQGRARLPSRGGSTASRGHHGSLLPVWIGDFHDSLFACLMRYEALQVS